jgi:hypothetical protein
LPLDVRCIPALPICSASDYVLLEKTGRYPVWPVVRQRDTAALEVMAALFGGALELVGGTRADPVDSIEQVGFMESTAYPHAVLYAHLTGRAPVFLPSIEAVRSTPSLKVLVGQLATLSIELVDALSDCAQQGRVIGLICAADLDALWLQVLLRSAALYFSRISQSEPVRRNGWIDMLPFVQVMEYRSHAYSVLGGTAGGTAIREALSMGVPLLRILTTSDGVDAYLGLHHLVLCPRGNNETGSNSFSPRCVLTKHCHRLDRSVDSAFASGQLVHPLEIRARVLIWQTCLGVLLRSPLVDLGWSLGRILNMSPHVGALITTVEYCLLNTSSTLMLATAIANGRLLGDALAEYSSLRSRDAFSPRLFLFGDPDLQGTRVSLPPEESALQIIPRRLSITSAFMRGEAPNVMANDAFAVIKHRAIPRLLAERDRVLVVAARSPSRDDSRGRIAMREFHDALAAYLIARRWARWIDDWLVYSESVERVSPSGRCPHCDGSLEAYRVGLSIPSAQDRRLAICSQCGPVEDVPFDSRLRFLVEPLGGYKIKGLPSDSSGTAYVAAFSDLEATTFANTIEWSCGSDSVQGEYPLSVWREPGPLRLALYLFDRSWHMLTVPLRRYLSAASDEQGADR